MLNVSLMPQFLARRHGTVDEHFLSVARGARMRSSVLGVRRHKSTRCRRSR
jgi:hypothetical protein